MARRELTPQEITDLLAGAGSGTRKKKDITEPRTTENWWKQDTSIIYRPDYEGLNIKCTNPDCKDTRPDDKTIILAQVKGTLICRYCFLDEYLST